LTSSPPVWVATVRERAMRGGRLRSGLALGFRQELAEHHDARLHHGHQHRHLAVAGIEAQRRSSRSGSGTALRAAGPGAGRASRWALSVLSMASTATSSVQPEAAWP
jgi:hypothetical protein